MTVEPECSYSLVSGVLYEFLEMPESPWGTGELLVENSSRPEGTAECWLRHHLLPVAVPRSAGPSLPSAESRCPGICKGVTLQGLRMPDALPASGRELLWVAAAWSTTVPAGVARVPAGVARAPARTAFLPHLPSWLHWGARHPPSPHPGAVSEGSGPGLAELWLGGQPTWGSGGSRLPRVVWL